MSTKEQYWKYSLIIIIIGLGIILFRQITPFLSGLLGALTIYILVRRQMTYLSEKRKMKRSIAATIITAEAILCFLIPLALVVWLAIINLQNINLDPQAIIAPFEQTAAIIKAKTGYNILGGDSLSFVLSSLPRIGQTLMGGISSFAVNMFVLVFVLYFMLIGGKKMEQYVNGILPFNETNTQNVVHEINMIVRSNAIGIPPACHNTRRSSNDRLLDIRRSQYSVFRLPDRICQRCSHGRHSTDMGSHSHIYGIDWQLAPSHWPGSLRCPCHLTA